jgi:rhodanese-related sulfurtransferase
LIGGALEIDIARYADLSKASATLQGSLPGLEKALVSAEETWNVVSTLSDDVDRQKNAHQAAEQALSPPSNRRLAAYPNSMHRNQQATATIAAHGVSGTKQPGATPVQPRSER